MISQPSTIFNSVLFKNDKSQQKLPQGAFYCKVKILKEYSACDNQDLAAT